MVKAVRNGCHSLHYYYRQFAIIEGFRHG